MLLKDAQNYAHIYHCLWLTSCNIVYWKLFSIVSIVVLYLDFVDEDVTTCYSWDRRNLPLTVTCFYQITFFFAFWYPWICFISFYFYNLCWKTNAFILFLYLQENNAIAVLDLASEHIEDIYPLGYKSWENSRLDASNKDNGKT